MGFLAAGLVVPGVDYFEVCTVRRQRSATGANPTSVSEEGLLST